MDERAKEYGIEFPEYPPMDESGTVDLWQLEANLALTPQERIRRYRAMIEAMNGVREAGIRASANHADAGAVGARRPAR